MEETVDTLNQTIIKNAIKNAFDKFYSNPLANEFNDVTLISDIIKNIYLLMEIKGVINKRYTSSKLDCRILINEFIQPNLEDYYENFTEYNLITFKNIIIQCLNNYTDKYDNELNKYIVKIKKEINEFAGVEYVKVFINVVLSIPFNLTYSFLILYYFIILDEND